MSVSTLLPRDAVLVVDDHEEGRTLLAAYLENAGHAVIQANGGTEAIGLIERYGPELGAVLLDLHMPRVDGYAVLRHVRADLHQLSLPIVVTSAESDRSARRRAAALGADEFLTKPIDQLELVARVRHLLRLRRMSRRMVSIQGLLDGLAAAIERRDKYTDDHTLRVAAYAARMGEALDLPAAARLPLLEGAILHDVGMVGVPDAILHSPQPLTADERAIVRRHVETGVQICAAFSPDSIVMQIVQHHHERWDGSGYPLGLREERIPLPARILSVADAFDAMTSDRPYRPRMEWNRAHQILSEGAGAQWDPEAVRTLQTVLASDASLVEAARLGGQRLRQLVALWRERLVRQVEYGEG